MKDMRERHSESMAIRIELFITSMDHETFV